NIIEEKVTEIEEEIIEIRREIHANPELGFQEFNTTNLIYNTLKDTEIRLEICEGGTGVIGVLEGETEGRVLGIRADIDALPIFEETGLTFSSKTEGKMHACGHDIHTSVLLGTALTLNKLRKQIKGTIKFIFQPAEETLGGAQFMIEQHALKNPDVDHLICLHTWPFTDVGKIGIRHNTIMASTNEFDIKVMGDSGHAAHPHKSIDPIPVATQIVDGLQQIVSRKLPPLESAVVTVAQIHGGTANNVIAKEVTISGTVRTLQTEISDKIKSHLKAISKNIAEAYGAQATINFNPGTPPVINDDFLVDLMEHTIKTNLGEDSLEYLSTPSLGGEDFSFYLNEVKGMLFRLGTGNELDESRKGLHNPKIIFDEKSIPTGIKALSHFAVNYFDKQ